MPAKRAAQRRSARVNGSGTGSGVIALANGVATASAIGNGDEWAGASAEHGEAALGVKRRRVWDGDESVRAFSLFFFLLSPISVPLFLELCFGSSGGLGDSPLCIGIDLNFACLPTPSLLFCNPKPKMTLKLTRDSLAANSPSHRHSPTRPCTTANSSSCTPAKRHTHTHTAASNRARRTRTAHRRLRGPTRGATTTTRGSTTTAARRTLVRA